MFVDVDHLVTFEEGCVGDFQLAALDFDNGIEHMLELTFPGTAFLEHNNIITGRVPPYHLRQHILIQRVLRNKLPPVSRRINQLLIGQQYLQIEIHLAWIPIGYIAHILQLPLKHIPILDLMGIGLLDHHQTIITHLPIHLLHELH